MDEILEKYFQSKSYISEGELEDLVIQSIEEANIYKVIDSLIERHKLIKLIYRSEIAVHTLYFDGRGTINIRGKGAIMGF